MLEEEWPRVDLEFPFMFYYINMSTEYIEEDELEIVNKMYFDHVPEYPWRQRNFKMSVSWSKRRLRN